MKLGQVRKIEVYRAFASGARMHVGTIAQNPDGVYFKYSTEYLDKGTSLSPYELSFDTAVQKGPREPHEGLHGVFADSLPDSWGRSLVDRYLRQQGINPGEVTVMDRLALVDHQSMGALIYDSGVQFEVELSAYNALMQLGTQAQALMRGGSGSGLRQLIYSGSAAGSRPKAQLYLSSKDHESCSLHPGPGLKPYLVKFTSSTFPLGHEEGLCEAAYMTLAADAGIQVAQWKLTQSRGRDGSFQWLAMERFDRVESTDSASLTDGRLHLQTVCGLIGADFRLPSLDYADLIKLGSQLCKSPAVGQEIFRRAIFNLYAVNQDDHSRNWSFLQTDDGNWELSPFYDVTFSPSLYGEHTTAFGGHGQKPPLAVVQRLADDANFANWQDARSVIQEVVETIQGFQRVAREFGLTNETERLIATRIDAVRSQNIGLSG